MSTPVWPAGWPAIVKGRGVLKAESGRWPEYCLVTTPSPWALVADQLSRPPRHVLVVQSLERVHLEQLAQAATGVEFVVGLGSGVAIDGAKYLAWRLDKPLVQVPSTVSNNAMFTRSAGCLVNGRRDPLRGVPLPREVLFDLELIAKAPGRLNRAGLGDLLCSYTSLVDWQLGHGAGVDVDWDRGLFDETWREVRSLEGLAPAIGADSLDAFVALFDMGNRFGPAFLRFPRSRFNSGSEHLFAWCLEQRLGRRLVHGEAVCLGTLLMAHMQGNDPAWVARVVKEARVAFQPEAIGTTWKDIEETVIALPAYARDVVPWYTVVDELPQAGDPTGLTSATKRARAFVESLN
jgi:glycerol-1-phosphate dehydrogenase [NAD(P)+]